MMHKVEYVKICDKTLVCTSCKKKTDRLFSMQGLSMNEVGLCADCMTDIWFDKLMVIA